MPMVLTSTPMKPFNKTYMDIVGPLPTTIDGNKYVLTFQDDLTKFMDCYPLPNREAVTVARTFYDKIISRYQIPKLLLTDKGTNFSSEFFKLVCNLLKIKKIETTAYHPQANGSLERCHRPLAEYLRGYVDNSPEE